MVSSRQNLRDLIRVLVSFSAKPISDSALELTDSSHDDFDHISEEAPNIINGKI
jgi:hypothetical protein